MLTERLKNVLFHRSVPFITVATCNSDGVPNAAPKLIVKYSRGHLYLVDVPYGQTYQNLLVNSQIAFSFVDDESLKAYRLKGVVSILDSLRHRKKFYADIDKVINKMIVDRILEGSHRGRGHANFLAKVPNDFIIFKTKIMEIVEYGLEDIKTRKSTKRKMKLMNGALKKG